jgi:hypothetical protein
MRSNADYGTVGVFETGPNESLVEIRHYATENSSLNHKNTAYLIPAPNGRFWTWGTQLVWIQSCQDLPQTLPNWISFVNNTRDTLIYIFSMFCLMFVLLGIWLALYAISRISRSTGIPSG